MKLILKSRIKMIVQKWRLIKWTPGSLRRDGLRRRRFPASLSPKLFVLLEDADGDLVVRLLDDDVVNVAHHEQVCVTHRIVQVVARGNVNQLKKCLNADLPKSRQS
jgi:hypothetical protein